MYPVPPSPRLPPAFCLPFPILSLWKRVHFWNWGIWGVSLHLFVCVGGGRIGRIGVWLSRVITERG